MYRCAFITIFLISRVVCHAGSVSNSPSPRTDGSTNIPAVQIEGSWWTGEVKVEAHRLTYRAAAVAGSPDYSKIHKLLVTDSSDLLSLVNNIIYRLDHHEWKELKQMFSLDDDIQVVSSEDLARIWVPSAKKTNWHMTHIIQFGDFWILRGTRQDRETKATEVDLWIFEWRKTTWQAVFQSKQFEEAGGKALLKLLYRNNVPMHSPRQTPGN